MAQKFLNDIIGIRIHTFDSAVFPCCLPISGKNSTYVLFWHVCLIEFSFTNFLWTAEHLQLFIYSWHKITTSTSWNENDGNIDFLFVHIWLFITSLGGDHHILSPNVNRRIHISLQVLWCFTNWGIKWHEFFVRSDTFSVFVFSSKKRSFISQTARYVPL